MGSWSSTICPPPEGTDSRALKPVVNTIFPSFVHAPDFPMPADGVRAARQETSLQRVRMALEARRMVGGRYPVSLESLGEDGSPLLAGVSLDDYSYSVSRGGYTLYRTRP